jgi:hypothetical protein
MPVVVCFKKTYFHTSLSPDSAAKLILETLVGTYLRVDLLVFTQDGKKTMFSIPAGGIFTKSLLDRNSVSDTTHDFLLIPSSQDEENKIYTTCEACATSKLKYNIKDVMLSSLPFRNPEEKSLFQPPQLYCSQSIVLILRECLDADNCLNQGLQGLHSRTVTASTLYQNIVQHCGPFAFDSVFYGSATSTTNSKPSEPAAIAASEDTGSAKVIHPNAELKTRKSISSQKSVFPETWDRW